MSSLAAPSLLLLAKIEADSAADHVWPVLKILLMILLAMALVFWWLRRQV